MLELLECRRLLSATIANRVLTITGTRRNDVISLRQTKFLDPAAGHLTPAVEPILNGQSEGRFLQSQFDSIVFFGDAGNDRISVPWGHIQNRRFVKGLSIPVSLEGSAGNDTLIGGDGNDTLVGGRGRDSLLGHAGNDLLSGGAAADTLLGGPDNDSLFGEAGNDQLRDNDIIAIGFINEHDADLLSGGPGDDSISFLGIGDLRTRSGGIQTGARLLATPDGRANDGVFENFRDPGGRTILYHDNDNINRDIERTLLPDWATSSQLT